MFIETKSREGMCYIIYFSFDFSSEISSTIICFFVKKHDLSKKSGEGSSGITKWQEYRLRGIGTPRYTKFLHGNSVAEQIANIFLDDKIVTSYKMYTPEKNLKENCSPLTFMCVVNR